jgi:hypothetical protein
MTDTNPNGANQFKLDPRQALCWANYINVNNSETFGNAYQSAIQAGYEEATAQNITSAKWFVDKYGRFNRLNKAEKVFDKILDMTSEEASIIRIQLDAAKFVAEKTSDEYKSKVDLTTKGKEVVGITYIIPEDNK